MDSFEKLVKNATEQLEEGGNSTRDTVMLRGIGYALLALATAIKKKGEGESS